MFTQLCGPSWKSKERIVATACITSVSLVSAAAYFAAKTIDSRQNADDLPQLLLPLVQTCLDPNKVEHLNRVQIGILKSQYYSENKDYETAQNILSDAVDELTDYFGLDTGTARLLLLQCGLQEYRCHNFDLERKYYLAAIKEPLPKSLPKKTFPVIVNMCMAKSFDEQKRWPEAVQAYLAVINKMKELSWAKNEVLEDGLRSLGIAYANSGNHVKAIETFDEALTLAERLPQSEKQNLLKSSLYLWRGFANKSLGKNQCAINDYRLAISKQLNWEDKFFEIDALYSVGVASFDEDKQADAIKAFNEALALLEKLPQSNEKDLWKSRVYYCRGLSNKALGENQCAVNDYRLSISKKLNWEDKFFELEALQGIGIASADDNKQADAIKAFNEALDLLEKLPHSDEIRDWKSNIYARRGSANLSSEKYESAIADFNLSISLSDSDSDSDLGMIYFYRAQSLAGLRQYGKALSDCDKAVVMEPQNGWFHYFRGETLAALGAHQKAISDFSLAAKYAHKDNTIGASGSPTGKEISLANAALVELKTEKDNLKK